jgi:signal transduction histidine kinase/ActR/RegA family two-component response regulator
LAKVSSPFPEVALGVGLLIALLVPSIVYLAQTARLQAAQLRAANQELEREIAEREQAEQALAHDSAERAQLEEQLRQSQKMEAIGQLAGGVAHDFNNLLTVITGYTEMLLDNVASHEPERVPLEEIRKAGDRAASLTHQLLAFSRKQILEPKILDLNTTIADIEKMLRRVIGEHIDLVTVLKGDLRPVKADPGQIQQVILNLAVNARDAMPAGGKLTVETANVNLDHAYAETHVEVQPGPYVMLAVSDTGCGMAPEILARVFEPFFTTKEVAKGTGMGLATVYGIVKQSGGSICVYSEPGNGTVFKIYLPSSTGDSAEENLSGPDAEIPRGTETVLVVEDEEAVRGLTRQVLEVNGYTVLEARHGDEAITLCQQIAEPIDLLLTDVIMPQMNGPELAARVTELYPALKVLFVSGYADHAIVRHGTLDPDTSFLQKPFSPAELARKVREVLDEPVASPI